MGLIITLILLGLVLIFAEILLIPGIGVAGILGLLSIGGSCFYAFHQMGTTVGVIVTVANAALLVALTIWVLRAKTWKKLTLETTVDGKAVAADEAILVGERGVTVTRLAPMGMVRFGGESVEVKALEGMIDPGVDVEVVMIEDKKIYVQPVGEDF
ncbi:MAG: NfeD family protein [Bacteroidales bacterium]|nr:NfeD family protein [Bacteroidales bacterium]